jgi:GT2 family glycosyltransferase
MAATPAIVIVTHNSADHIRACLDACRRVLPQAEMCVVDNASIDGTVRQAAGGAGPLVIPNPDNRGFAAAVNQGVRATTGDPVLLLNPDTEIESGMAEMIAACCAPGYGAAGGRLLAAGGRPQRGFYLRRFPTAATLAFEALGVNRLWPGNPVNRRYRCLDLDPALAADVDQPAGAFLMFRRAAWERVGGFDEGFQPVWFEDVDFCLRLRQAGFRIRYVPSAAARHAGAHSIRQMEWNRRQVLWYVSLLRYTAKHLTRHEGLVVRGAVVLGALPRMLVALGAGRGREAVAVYREVVRYALGSGMS